MANPVIFSYFRHFAITIGSNVCVRIINNSLAIKDTFNSIHLNYSLCVITLFDHCHSFVYESKHWFWNLSLLELMFSPASTMEIFALTQNTAHVSEKPTRLKHFCTISLLHMLCSVLKQKSPFLSCWLYFINKCFFICVLKTFKQYRRFCA